MQAPTDESTPPPPWPHSRTPRRFAMQCPRCLHKTQAKNPPSLALLHRAAKGQAFGQVALLMDLRVLVLGGGAGPCADLLKEATLATTAKQAFGRTAEDFVVLASPLGNDAGVLGAGVFTAKI